MARIILEDLSINSLIPSYNAPADFAFPSKALILNSRPEQLDTICDLCSSRQTAH